MTRVRMPPSSIRYTHDCIGKQFRDEHFLSETFHELIDGSITPDDIRPIEIVAYDGSYWVISGIGGFFSTKPWQNQD